jgi:aminoglycoside 2''-phosphotransferase
MQLPEEPDLRPYLDSVRACLPEFEVRTVRPILMGWASLVLEINDQWILRFPRWPEIIPQLDKEHALLPDLARALPVAVPRYVYWWRDYADCAQPFVGYRKIEGQPLDMADLQGDAGQSLARDLGQALGALHAFPLARARMLHVPGGDIAAWRKVYEDLYADVQTRALPLCDPATRAWFRDRWERFLATEANWRFQPALIHGDLAAEHILWDATTHRIAGIIDWEDACIGDPAMDFVGLLGCGAAFTECVLAGYTGQVDDTFRQRMAFRGDIFPFFGILFGLDKADDARLQHGLAIARAHAQRGTEQP